MWQEPVYEATASQYTRAIPKLTLSYTCVELLHTLFYNTGELVLAIPVSLTSSKYRWSNAFIHYNLGVTFAKKQLPWTSQLGQKSSRYSLAATAIKPRTDERSTVAELCVSSTQFPLLDKFVQTFNFVQISWHCLHKIAGAVSDHSSHHERRCTCVVSVWWMTQHYTKKN